jgi:hypothetical protein
MHDIGKRLAEDFEFFAEQVLRIRDKDGLIVPFKLNTAQKYLHARIEAQKKKTGRVRVIGLKGRQQGYSTYVQARYSGCSINAGATARCARSS